MKTFFIAAAVGAISLIYACETPQKMVNDSKTFTQDQISRVVKDLPGTTVQHLTQGKALYETKCNTCHNLKDPNSETIAAWKQIVPNMAQKANLDSESSLNILRYVLAMRTAN